jgi:hypothetical protein
MDNSSFHVPTKERKKAGALGPDAYKRIVPERTGVTIAGTALEHDRN